MSILFYYVQLQKYKKERVSTNKVEEETDEIKKIKKVKSISGFIKHNKKRNSNWLSNVGFNVNENFFPKFFYNSKTRY